MSLRTKISAAIRGDAPTENPPEYNPEVEPVFDALRTAESTAENIKRRIDHLAGELLEKERAQRRAALEKELDGNAEPYERLSRDIEALRADINGARLALEGSQEAIAEAKAEAHRLGIAGMLKTQRRINNQRAKAADEFSMSMQAAVAAAFKLRELNEKNLFAWPVGTAGWAPAGAILGDNELERVLEREISRLAPPPPISPTFVFPGARYEPVHGDPALYDPMVAEIERANEYLLQCIERPPAPVVAAETSDLVLMPDNPSGTSAQGLPAPSNTENDND